jgi:uncharacterized protein (DUF924 family)
MDQIDEILDYWFGAAGSSGDSLWFSGSPEIDADIRARFGDLVEPALSGALDDWAITARGRLALILVLDQFMRNLGRGSARAYAGDAAAQRLCLEGLERGHDRELPLIQRWFLYMPMEHAESRELQEHSVACFTRLLTESPPDKRQIYQGALDYAIRHRDVIARFGRFPHRNQVLGRTTTAQEQAFLDSTGWF